MIKERTVLAVVEDEQDALSKIVKAQKVPKSVAKTWPAEKVIVVKPPLLQYLQPYYTNVCHEDEQVTRPVNI